MCSSSSKPSRRRVRAGAWSWVGALWAVLLAAPAWAQPSFGPSLEGWGRIGVLGGYRWVPNWYFFDRAQGVGTPLVSANQGGPQAQVSFGYGASEWLEVAVDLFAGVDAFELDGPAPFTAYTYGALLGARLVASEVPVPRLSPYLGAGVGPTFVLLQSRSVRAPERLVIGLAVLGGVQWQVHERWAVSLDVRWLLARGSVPGVSSFNAGGVLFSLGVSYRLPPEPQRGLEIPGFGGSSRR